MKILKLSLPVLCAFLVLSSCASLRRGSSRVETSPAPVVVQPRQPVVREEAPRPAATPVVTREERVTHVEHTGPAFQYYVILGSFRVLDNARNFRSDLSRQNFTPVILENEQGLYRVSVAAFNDELPARERVATIRSQHPQYNDVWLLIRIR